MKDKIKKEKIREDTTLFSLKGNCCVNMLKYTYYTWEKQQTRIKNEKKMNNIVTQSAV